MNFFLSKGNKSVLLISNKSDYIKKKGNFLFPLLDRGVAVFKQNLTHQFKSSANASNMHVVLYSFQRSHTYLNS